MPGATSTSVPASASVAVPASAPKPASPVHSVLTLPLDERNPAHHRLRADLDFIQAQVFLDKTLIAGHTRDIHRLLPIQDRVNETQALLQSQQTTIRRLDERVTQLLDHYRGLHELVDNVSKTRLAAPPANPNPAAQDRALELMANNLSTVSQKANEIDALKMSMEIIKGKIQRLEDANAPSPSIFTPTFPPPPAPMLDATRPKLPIVPPAITVPAMQPSSRPAAASLPYPPVAMQPARASTNSPIKRGPSIGDEGALSPKRAKLNDMPSAAHFPPSQPRDNATVTDSDPRSQAVPAPSISPNSGAPNFPPQEASVPDFRRHDFYHVSHASARGRPRVRPSGRSGRSPGRSRRDSGGFDYTSHTLQQPQPQHMVMYGGHNIMRRGSGGGTASQASRIVTTPHPLTSPASQAVSASSAFSAEDSSSQGKKTRSKPTRNSEGVLIRKDGQPDMRAMSSAQNLRKVHARQQESREQAAAGSRKSPNSTPVTPTVAVPPAARFTPATPDTPTAAAASSQLSTIERNHQAIMDKMFPHGVDATRERHGISKQLHALTHARGEQRPIVVKKEPDEGGSAAVEAEGADPGDGDEEHGDEPTANGHIADLNGNATEENTAAAHGTNGINAS